MCGMAIELRGFDDLKDDLVNMAYALDQGPGVNRALKAGAVPIEQQMLHNASTDPKIITDALHSSIHTGSVKKRRGSGKQSLLRQPCGVWPRRTRTGSRASLCPSCL